MKKVQLLVMLILATTITFAQSEKYTKKMTEMITQLDTTKTAEEFTTLATAFERIADAEKTQWLPYYYASLCQLNAANFQIQGMGDNSAIADPAADKAEELLNKALALGKESSETWVIKKMIATMRMMANPMQRFMEYGPIAATALEKAKKLDPTNPRVYILEGQDKQFTPEQFGGSKKEAKKLFAKAVELFKTFKAESALHPNWGLGTANYFLNLQEQ